MWQVDSTAKRQQSDTETNYMVGYRQRRRVGRKCSVAWQVGQERQRGRRPQNGRVYSIGMSRPHADVRRQCSHSIGKESLRAVQAMSRPHGACARCGGGGITQVV